MSLRRRAGRRRPPPARTRGIRPERPQRASWCGHRGSARWVGARISNSSSGGAMEEASVRIGHRPRDRCTERHYGKKQARNRCVFPDFCECAMIKSGTDRRSPAMDHSADRAPRTPRAAAPDPNCLSTLGYARRRERPGPSVPGIEHTRLRRASSHQGEGVAVARSTMETRHEIDRWQKRADAYLELTLMRRVAREHGIGEEQSAQHRQRATQQRTIQPKTAVKRNQCNTTSDVDKHNRRDQLSVASSQARRRTRP